MKRILIGICVMFMVVSLRFSIDVAQAADKCSVTGEVSLSGEHTVYLYLLNANSFREFKRQLPDSPYKTIIKPDAEDLKVGKATFIFENIPKGDYVLFAYVDGNENEKPDFDGWGFTKERTWFFRAAPMASWYEQKFTIDGDVEGIQLLE